MKDLLLNCYYDNMSIEQTKALVLSCYGKLPTEKQIKSAQNQILHLVGKLWG